MRLKTKLVLAISSLVMAVVGALSLIYLSQIIQQRVTDEYGSGQFVANQIYHATREALEADLNNSARPSFPRDDLNEAVQESLQMDAGLDSLLQGIVGYSRTIYDASVVDLEGKAFVHTDSAMVGKPLAARPDFAGLVNSRLWTKLRVVYGAPQVYEIRIPLQRNGTAFGSVRVGLSTVFLKSELQPQLNRAITFSLIAILASLVLAAALSNLALRPLETISRRLDQMTSDGSSPPAPVAGDEVGIVTTKIDRLGREMRDVKEVFSALKENLEQMMANLQDGVMLFNAEGTAILVSASAEGFVGKPRGEILGRDFNEVFSPDTRVGSLLLRAFDSRQPIFQSEVKEANKRLQVSLDFIQDRGQQIGALLTLRDAESVRKLEDEIELSRRLAAIGRLTSGVAHEVKNPINAIVVHLEVLRQKMNPVDPDTRRHVDVISSEIQRLDRVVQTLVDFSRPVELRLVDYDLRALVDDVVLLASPQAAKHSVVIEQLPPAGPVMARIDADLMKQALLNVIINGIQAMDSGGSLKVTLSSSDAEALIEVSDQGPGIPADIRDKIFNLYFTTKKTGTGIGLAMAYRVMQLHNGSLDYRPVKDGLHGTRFAFRLPLLTRAGARTEQNSIAVPQA